MGDFKSGECIIMVIKFIAGFATLLLAFSVLSAPAFMEMTPVDWFRFALGFGAVISGYSTVVGVAYKVIMKKYEKDQKG